MPFLKNEKMRKEKEVKKIKTFQYNMFFFMNRIKLL